MECHVRFWTLLSWMQHIDVPNGHLLSRHRVLLVSLPREASTTATTPVDTQEADTQGRTQDGVNLRTHSIHAWYLFA